MASLPFKLVSPEKVLFNQDVNMVVIPGLKGDIGILPNHASFLTLLRPGVITIYEDTKIFIKFFVNGGFSFIRPEECVALVTEGILLEALDKSALEIEIKNLIEESTDKKTPEERKIADQNLEIAKAKLTEILTHQQSK